MLFTEAAYLLHESDRGRWTLLAVKPRTAVESGRCAATRSTACGGSGVEASDGRLGKSINYLPGLLIIRGRCSCQTLTFNDAVNILIIMRVVLSEKLLGKKKKQQQNTLWYYNSIITLLINVRGKKIHAPVAIASDDRRRVVSVGNDATGRSQAHPKKNNEIV